MYSLDKEKLKRYYIHCKTEEEMELLVNCCRKLTDWLDKEDIEDMVDSIKDTWDDETVFDLDELGITYVEIEDIHPKDAKPLDFFLIKENKTKTEKPTKKIKENKQTKGETTMKNLKNIGTEIAKNAKEAVVTSKDAIVTAQLGNTGLQAVKTGLKNSSLPQNVKALLDTPVYGDVVVGLIANIAVPTITDNEKAKDVVQAMNIVSMMGLSNQFTWIQDIVKNSIESVVGIGENKTENTKKN
jgi:hypothetical protein